MSSSIPSVLLDLDGTLIDSQPGILASCRVALRALGHEPGAALDIAAIIGPPIEDVVRLLVKPYQDDRVDEAVAAYRKDYGSSLSGGVLYGGTAVKVALLGGSVTPEGGSEIHYRRNGLS